MATPILDLTKDIRLLADMHGLLLVGVNTHEPLSAISSNPAINQFLSSIPTLISDELLEEKPEGLLFSLDSLQQLENRDYDPLSTLFNWSPYLMQIASKGSLGFPDFKFVTRFFLGRRNLPIRVVGAFAWRNTKIVRLPARQAIAISLIAAFNSLPAASKDKTTALDYLYQLKQLSNVSHEFGFDEYLTAENVVKAEKVRLGVEDDGKHATVYPVIEGTNEAEVKRYFLNTAEVQDVYDLEAGAGRQRVLIGPDVKKVLRAVKKNGFGITGAKRETFYRNPRSLLPEDEGINPDLIDIAGFGPRVTGIGYPAFVRPISSGSKEHWFECGEVDAKVSHETKDSTLSLECEFIDGEKQLLRFDSETSAKEFIDCARAALVAGEPSFQWQGNSVPVSEHFISGCEAVLEHPKQQSTETDSPSKEKRSNQSLLIHTNEESQDYSEDVSARTGDFQFECPKGLKDTVTLKPHQVDGIHWLQNLVFNDVTKGGLLADEMGLGKTLQLLSFLSWCIEGKGADFKEALTKPEAPYDPILVVAPLILLDTWIEELQKYFDESIFQPFEVLHGNVIKKYRTAEVPTKEADIARETLAIDRLCRNRLIVTNYDTVKNYQYTFAKVPWSIVVVDEAQEIKEPSTATTYALKALNPLFRVASTGTPVETSLTNLWSIMDFVHPGNPLGTLKEFTKTFATKNFDDPILGNELRERLRFNSQTGYVKRRIKRDVLKDLPEKKIIIRDCRLEGALRERYLDVVSSVSSSTNAATAALHGLHSLALLSQHPYLVEDNPFHDDYLSNCTKLQALVEILRQVKGLGEKALVFTRSRPMQDILKSVLDRTFDLNTKIVNGSTASRHKYVSDTRKGIIDDFSKSAGFNVLLLSPEVAGVGLTITAANHVVHYGRWWNPAKENQATDRVYRIGQTKPVFVYHLILKDPQGVFETFDEKLHRLLESREALADNFLSVGYSEAKLQENLAGDLFSKKASNRERTSTRCDVNRLSPYEFEALAALLFSKRCPQVILTPKSGDRGIDFIGLGTNEIVLFQCKFLANREGYIQEEVTSELIDGSDYYREHVLPAAVRHLPIKLALVTTGRFDSALKKSSKNLNIELVGGDVFLKLHNGSGFTLADIKQIETTRSKNMQALIEQVCRLVQDGTEPPSSIS